MTPRYDDPEYQKAVSLQMLATPTHEIACRTIVDIRREFLKEILEKGTLLGKANVKISELQKDSDELNAAKRAVFNAFTGGKLFPGENK
jgi:hypothetical protein